MAMTLSKSMKVAATLSEQFYDVFSLPNKKLITETCNVLRVHGQRGQHEEKGHHRFVVYTLANKGYILWIFSSHVLILFFQNYRK